MACTNLEYMYDHDKRALSDFVSCTSYCYDCRAKIYCDRLTAFDPAITEVEFLMAEMGNEVESIAEMREMFGKRPIGKEKQDDRA